MNRAQLTTEVEAVGQRINELRTAALENRFPFVAGVIRGAEETVLVAFTMLKDANPEEL